jgi:ATP-binding cassette subfamily B protein
MNHIIKILKFANQLWRYYIVIGLLTVLVSFLGLSQPAISGWAIDELRKGSHSNVRFLVLLALAILVTDIFSNLINNIIGYLGDQMNGKLYKILSSRYYEHVLSLDQSYFDNELSGKIINRLNRSILQITNFLQSITNNFLQFIFGTVFALIIVAYYSWQVALLLFLLYPIYIFLTIRSSKPWQKYQTEKNLNLDIATGRFAESIGQVKVVKSFIQEKRELNFFDHHMDKYININKPQSTLWHSRDFVRRLSLNVIFFLVYIYIFVEAAHGIYSPGVAVALILYSMQIRIPIFTISFLMDNFQRAISDSKDYFEVMDTIPKRNDVALPKIENIQGRISFSDVYFSYNKDLILKGVNLDIDANTKIALVGESGEGKTTLTNLLLKLYIPNKGTIKIDGLDISDYDDDSIRQNIGVVFQDPSLFSGSIRENIAYSNPNVEESEIVKASKAANAHDFIHKLDKGYDTEIGERGLKLSGGQKQRIAIARAILKNAPILILDEATSSLDSRSENMVQKALNNLMKNKTTIIIAHRLSTISHVDKIITLKDGNVDESGTPKDLSKSGGIYSQLLELQNNSLNEETIEQLKHYDISSR